MLQHPLKNDFCRCTFSVFVLQKLYALQPVIPDSHLNPCPDNAGVALPFLYAVWCLRQVDFIKGKRVHLRLIVTDGFEVESACQKANDQKCRNNNQDCFITPIHHCSALYHRKTSERFSRLT